MEANEILNKLSSVQGRRDEEPNELLARELAEKGDQNSIAILVEQLRNKNKRVQNDCIKVIYEIGAIKPELISDHGEVFLSELNAKNNRIQWGAMAALASIVHLRPDFIYESLPVIMSVSDKGSVITRDGAFSILISLSAIPEYSDNTVNLVLEQLMNSQVNQLPMYAERALAIAKDNRTDDFVAVIESRLTEVDKESKKKRLLKVLKKLSS